MTHDKKYWNKEMETLPPERYHKIQEERLMKQLDYVWENSGLYREKYRSAGVERNDIKSLSDISKLPFTEKYDIRESLAAAPPLGKHACVDMKDVIRIYSTSGTTGNPTYIALTSHDRDVWAEGAMRAMWTCGMRPEHVVPLPIGTFFIAASYGEAIERLGSTLVPVGIGATDRFLGAVRNLGANYVLSTASFPLYLINYCEKKCELMHRLWASGVLWWAVSRAVAFLISGRKLKTHSVPRFRSAWETAICWGSCGLNVNIKTACILSVRGLCIRKSLILKPVKFWKSRRGSPENWCTPLWTGNPSR